MTITLLLKEAYRGYILAYNSHQLKDIFNVHMLDLKAVAKSFGFTGPPRVRSPSRSLLVKQSSFTSVRCTKEICTLDFPKNARAKPSCFV